MASDLVISRSRFSNIEEFCRCIRGAEIQAVQLRPGAFSGSVAYCAGGGVMFSAGRFDGDIRTRGVLPRRVTLAVHCGPGTSVSQWDLDALPGDIFLMPPGTEQEGRAAGRVTYATVSLDDAALARLDLIAGLGGIGGARQLRRFRAPPEVRYRIARGIHGLAKLMGSGDHAAAWRGQMLPDSLLWPFVLGMAGHGGLGEIRAPRPGVNLVRRVEDWIDQRPNESIHVFDACRALKVPLRTLQRGFHAELGMGPSHYLTLRRLARARATLLESEPGNTSVTDIALSYGFWELGRFAGAYRQIYGEKPSETLHRGHAGSGRSARLM